MARFSLLIIGLCVALPALTLAAPIVANGSFEADVFSGSGTLGLGCGNTLTGWTTQCSPDSIYPWGLQNGNVYNGGPTPYGNQWVIIGDFGSGNSYIQQLVTGFTIGQTYRLDFAAASEGVGNGSRFEVSVPTGSSTGSQIFTAPLRGANYWDTWGNFSYSFLASSTSVTIRFTGLTDNGNGALDAGIDNVSIQASTSQVPEPTSFILMGIGLVAVGTRRFLKV